MGKTRLKTGDTVIVIAGKDTKPERKVGKILDVDRKNNKVLVQGVNMVTKHTKPNANNRQGGIVHQEAYIDASNVMYLHKGKPTRIGIKVTKVEKDGKVEIIRQRIAKSTGEII